MVALAHVRVLLVSLLVFGSSLVNAQVSYRELEKLSVTWTPILEEERYTDHKRQETALQSFRQHSRRVDALTLLPASLPAEGWRVDGGAPALFFAALLADMVSKTGLAAYYNEKLKVHNPFATKDGKICGDHEIIVWENSLDPSLIAPKRVANYLSSQLKQQGFAYQEADYYNGFMDVSDSLLGGYEDISKREGHRAARKEVMSHLTVENLMPPATLQEFREADSPREFRKLLEARAALGLHLQMGFALKKQGRTFAVLVGSIPWVDRAPKLYGSYLVLCNKNHNF